MVAVLLILMAACQPGPPPTPTIPPSLDFTLTPTWSSPTPSQTLIPTITPTATNSRTPSVTPVVATYTPSATTTLGVTPETAIPATLPPPTVALTPVALPTNRPVTLVPVGTPVSQLFYTPSNSINSLPIPQVVSVDQLPRQPVNAAFDGGSVQQGAMEVVVPAGWTAWWRTGAVDCRIYDILNTTGPCPAEEEPGLVYRRPEFTVIPSAGPWVDPPRVYGDGQAARFFCTYGICVAGYLQRVQVSPGEAYVLSARVQSWCTREFGSRYESQLETRDDQLNCELAVGLDPTGGVDPLSANIIWQSIYAYDQFQYVATAPVVASGPAMTLYLRGRSLWGLRHNDFHFDEISFAAQ